MAATTIASIVCVCVLGGGASKERAEREKRRERGGEMEGERTNDSLRKRKSLEKGEGKREREGVREDAEAGRGERGEGRNRTLNSPERFFQSDATIRDFSSHRCGVTALLDRETSQRRPIAASNFSKRMRHSFSLAAATHSTYEDISGCRAMSSNKQRVTCPLERTREKGGEEGGEREEAKTRVTSSIAKWG